MWSMPRRYKYKESVNRESVNRESLIKLSEKIKQSVKGRTGQKSPAETEIMCLKHTKEDTYEILQ